ncbi:MAG: CCC motif membrane protein [Bacteroidales bacterium]
MENTNQSNQAQRPQGGVIEPLPNSTAVLVLGIVSIVAVFCSYGLFGIVLGILGLVLSGKPINLYTENPEAYTESSYKNLKAGRICSIIGLSLGGLFILLGILAIIGIFGGLIALLPFLDSLNIDMITFLTLL